MQEIVGAFKDTEVPKKVQAAGVHVADVKYFVIKAEDSSIYGKKVRPVFLAHCWSVTEHSD